jgi:hypothetical protein
MVEMGGLEPRTLTCEASALPAKLHQGFGPRNEASFAVALWLDGALQQRDGAELLTPDEVVLLERLAAWLAGSIAAIRAEQYERLLRTSKDGA